MRLLTKWERYWDWLLVKLHLRKPPQVEWVANIGWKHVAIKDTALYNWLSQDTPPQPCPNMKRLLAEPGFFDLKPTTTDHTAQMPSDPQSEQY